MVGRENHKENDLGTVNKLMYKLRRMLFQVQRKKVGGAGIGGAF